MFRKASVETALASAMLTRMVMLISLGWHQLDSHGIFGSKLRDFWFKNSKTAILVDFGGVWCDSNLSSDDPPSFGLDFFYLSSKLLGPLCIHTSEVHHGANHRGCQDLNKTQTHYFKVWNQKICIQGGFLPKKCKLPHFRWQKTPAFRHGTVSFHDVKRHIKRPPIRRRMQVKKMFLAQEFRSINPMETALIALQPTYDGKSSSTSFHQGLLTG